MANYDKKVLDCFLKNQLQPFPEKDRFSSGL